MESKEDNERMTKNKVWNDDRKIVCVNIEKQNTRNGSKDICIDCGGYCCTLGGVVATQNEVDAIIKLGYPNHFIQLSKDVYGIEWGKDGSCVYLKDGTCSIYSVRPLGCRVFPVVQTRNHEIILIKCSLASHLSNDEVLKRKKTLIERPWYIIAESEHLREDHIKDLEMRATKYGHQKI